MNNSHDYGMAAFWAGIAQFFAGVTFQSVISLLGLLVSAFIAYLHYLQWERRKAQETDLFLNKMRAHQQAENKKGGLAGHSTDRATTTSKAFSEKSGTQ